MSKSNKISASTVLLFLEKIRVFLEPLTSKVLGPTPTEEELKKAGVLRFEDEADAIVAARSLVRARAIVRTALLIMLCALVWAALAKVDEVARGDGRVIPSKQLQVIQALDGGVVSQILVKEGQVVEAGQLLLKIDETRATSGVRESAAQSFALQAKQARLKALAEGVPFSPPIPKDGDLEEARIVEEEKNLYLNRVSQMDALVSISRQQLAQRMQELDEARAKRSSAQRTVEISQQELNKTKPLLSSGAVSEVDILRLERDISRARGDVEQAAAQGAKAQAAIAEAQRKIQETELNFRNDARRELSEVLGRLSALNEGAVALADKVDKSNVKSPVRGRVQRLFANTIGGVIQPGKDIVQIVPLDDALVLEARVSPRDIAFIHPGQDATVKFTAYDFSIYGGLDGKVENISPDTVVDEKGNAYYLVRIKTDKPSFNDKAPIIPGMTAEIDILTGKKTVLSYLMKPVLRAKAYALRER